MYKILVLYPKPDDPEHFRRYYRETHLPLASHLPGLKASRYSFDVQTVGGGPYFCIWEGEFEDEAAAGAAMQSEAGQRVVEDVANYATGGHMLLQFPVERFA
jgi:uncharacterized protein (TIGR02118 family)